MKFDLEKSLEILERTPTVIRALLSAASKEWVMNNEGAETFSPYDVVGHLIQGEKTDWPERIKVILEYGTTKTFMPYDRFAMFTESAGKPIAELLNEFEQLRKVNIEWLRSLNLSETDFMKKGNHPTFGEVTLGQLVATWVVHDLTHLSQITRVMAKQYKEEIGPWVQFFRLMNY
ncbi:MAG TPA: DinB family protein [Panacibacter sp.]|nr:DinB family protein [Panacibacter sp.]